MASKTLLLAAAVAAAFTGSATAGDRGANSGTFSVCHVTGPKNAPIARGHVLTLPQSAIPGHTGHGDVVLVGEDVNGLVAHLRSTGGCGVNAGGDVVDGNGLVVQPGTGAPAGPAKKPSTHPTTGSPG